jgi:hypothetical protein
MSATDVAASVPCLITILKRFGWRVFILRRRLSRIKIRIQRAEKENQPGTKLDVQQKDGVSVSAERNEDVLEDCYEAILVREGELSVDLERYEDQLNDCVAWIHERTGIPTSRLLEVATSTPDGDEWGYIYAELKKLEERHVNAELWKALLSRDPDALVSVGLLPSSESSPALPEMENRGSKANDELGLSTLLSIGLLASSESSPALPETENQGGKADDELGLTTMLSVGLLPSPKANPPAARPDMHATGTHETPRRPMKGKKLKRPRMSKQKIESHWREVMNCGNRDLIEEYLTLGEVKLAKKIGTSRGTLRECECFKNRKDELQKFNREHGAPKRR